MDGDPSENGGPAPNDDPQVHLLSWTYHLHALKQLLHVLPKPWATLKAEWPMHRKHAQAHSGEGWQVCAAFAIA